MVLYARQWCDTPEDVVQQVLLDFVTLRQPPDDPPGWLYRAVRHRAIDAHRAAQRRQRREAEVARQAHWFVQTDVEGLDAEAAVAALHELPLEQREVIVAHLWGGLSFEAIGSLVECAASTAFRRYSAGLATLRQKLGATCPTH